MLKYQIFLALSFILNIAQLLPCDVCKIEEFVLLHQDQDPSEETHHDTSLHISHAFELLNQEQLQQAFLETQNIISYCKKNSEQLCLQVFELLLKTLPYSSDLIEKEYIETITDIATQENDLSNLAYKYIIDSQNINTFAIFVIKLINSKKEQVAFEELKNYIDSKKANNQPIDELILKLLMQIPQAKYYILMYFIDEIIVLANNDEDAKELLKKENNIHIARLIQVNKKQEAFELIKSDKVFSQNLDLLMETLPCSKEFIRQNHLIELLKEALNGNQDAYNLATQFDLDIILSALKQDEPYSYEFIIRNANIWIKYIQHLIKFKRIASAFNEAYNLMQTYQMLDRQVLLKLFLQTLPNAQNIIKKEFEKEVIALAQSGDKAAINFLKDNPGITLSKSALKKLTRFPC